MINEILNEDEEDDEEIKRSLETSIQHGDFREIHEKSFNSIKGN